MSFSTSYADCRPFHPIGLDTHETGLALAERYSLSIYDAMIAAAALHADCNTRWSEDMQDGLMIEGRLRIANPFSKASTTTYVTPGMA